MKKSVAALAILLVTLVSVAHAQIKIDVKTELSKKPQLTVLKNAAIVALNKSPLFEVVNHGEDYSFWITGTSHRKMNDSLMVTTIAFQVRTPAFLTHGDLLRSEKLTQSYNPQKVVHKENISALRQQLSGLITTKQWIARLIKLSRKYAPTIATSGEPISMATASILYFEAPKIRNYLESIHINTSRMALAEAMLVGNDLKNYLIKFAKQ